MRRVALTSLALFAFSACSRDSSAPATGSLSITVTGVPNGQAWIILSGPASFLQSVTGTITLTNLAPGDYSLTILNSYLTDGVYGASPSNVSVTVVAGTTPAAVTVPYVLVSGAIAVTVSGLPTGVNADVFVGGPAFGSALIGSQTLGNLLVGTYSVQAHTVSQGTTTYGGLPVAQSITLTPSIVPVPASIVYAAMTGQLRVTVNAPPAGLSPSVLVTGPFTYSHAINSAGLTTLGALPLGNYTVSASTLSTSTDTYDAAAQSPTLRADSLDVPATVTWAVSSGALTVTPTGLPSGVDAALTVTGPNGFTQAVTTTTTLHKLVPGQYVISSAPVTSGTDTYTIAPDTQRVSVTPSVTPASATVKYVTFDLSVDHVYLTQAAQTLNDSVPLVASRAGVLRVFVRSSKANTYTPSVRVRWYSSGALIETDMIPAPVPAVPTVTDESSMVSSWNLPVPATLIQPGLAVLADVDPTASIPEGDKTDNIFPASGVPLAFDVRTASPLHITLVPVRTAADGRTGNVSTATAEQFLSFAQRIHPIPSHVVTVHAPYTTAVALPLLSSDGNGAWSTILGEISALSAAENAPASQYYYGVVNPTYSAGIAGLGYIGFPVAIGWDKQGFDQILAHEIGHNFGRSHSPCGNPAGPDPNYPYAGGGIGVFGMDVSTETLVQPSSTYDIMSYCRPYWVSDYTYEGVLDYRALFNAALASAPARIEEPALLVWGHIRDGALVLEPAFEIDAMASLPEGSGAYAIEGLDVNGATLFSYRFAGREIADAPGGARSFAFVIPMSQLPMAELATLRLSGRGGTVERRGGVAAAALRSGTAPSAAARARPVTDGVSVTWDHTAYPMALIRDARTGEVLSFARGGAVLLRGGGGALAVQLSDGVRSVQAEITTSP